MSKQETVLLITADDIIKYTSLSGNIDIDSITPWVYSCQTNEIKRILTTNLYNKIVADYEAGTLTGIYKQIHNDYIIDMLVYFATSDYLKASPYKIGESGVYKMRGDNADIPDINEIYKLSAMYDKMGNASEKFFVEFMTTNYTQVPEYAITGSNQSSTYGLDWIL